MTPTEVSAILAACKSKLWDYRLNVRPKPHRDEKVIKARHPTLFTSY
jgi:hypothetical protein